MSSSTPRLRAVIQVVYKSFDVDRNKEGLLTISGIAAILVMTLMFLFRQ